MESKSVKFVFQSPVPLLLRADRDYCTLLDAAA